MNKENQKWLGVAALVSAGAASLCCIGPVVFLALGLGSLGAFAFFERYRPLLMGVTALILGAGFYFTYRRREVACEDGTCKMASGSPKAKATLWSITVLAAVFMTAPYWLAALNRRGEPPTAALAAGSYQTVRLGVKGMTCSACAVSIEKSIRKVSGVKAAVVDFDKAEAQVTVDSTRGVDSQSLVKAVESTGYSASVKD